MSVDPQVTAKRKFFKGMSLMKFGTIGLFVGICILFASLSPIFLLPANLLNIVKQATILAIMSFGMTLVIIVTKGEADLSVGGVAGFSAATTVTLLVAGVPLIFAALAGVAGGVLLGLLNGLLVSKIGLLPFLASLAVLNVGQGLEQVLTKGKHVPHTDPVLSFIANDTISGIPVGALVLVGVFVLFYLFMDHTATGQKIYAVGGNLHAAESFGINVNKYIVIAFTLSGLCSGLAGVILVGRLSGLTPLAATPMLLDVLLAGYISSTLSSVTAPNIPGALFGALLVGVLSNGLAVINVPTFYMNLIKGILILIVVAVNITTQRKQIMNN